MKTLAEHVLIIGKVWIEPNSSAAGSRTLQLMDAFLAKGWKITFATTASESPHKVDLASRGVEEFSIILNHPSFDLFIKNLNPSIVVFDRFITEEQFGWRVKENCPNALRILDTIDLHCLRIARQQALKQNKEVTTDDLFNETAKREVASVYRCDLSLMISEVEMDLLSNYFKVPKILSHYTPFLLDAITEKDQQSWLPYEDRGDFISIGNFLHEPNWDSVLYLKSEIWPLIHKQLPSAKMLIYGAYPSQKVFELNNPQEGFLIKGRAENANDVMGKARICLAPLRFGAGMKGKLIDAMLCGTPSVTTPIGAEAMHGNLPWNGAIEDTPEAIAAAAVNLYNNKSDWNQAQKNGVNIINQFFSREEHAENLIDAISKTQNSIEEHRRNNFTGAMLMQQSHAATKYMALWIEAKNKNV